MTAYYPDQPGPSVLTRMLNDLLLTAFVPDDISYGVPYAMESEGRNTALAFEIVRGPLTGKQSTCHYNRLDLQNLIGARNIQIQDTGSINSVADVLAIIQSTYNFALTADDIDDNALVIDSYPVLVNLVAKPGSYLVYGSATVQIVAADQGGGGTPGTITSTVNTTLTGQFVDANNGFLYILDANGEVLGSESFLVTTDGAFTIGLRLYSDWDWYSNSLLNGTYDLSGVDVGGSSWNIDWVAGMADGSMITDSYDVRLRVEVGDQPSVPVVLLNLTSVGEGGWALLDPTMTVSIPVTLVSGELVFESTFSASLLAPLLTGVTTNVDGAPTGDFVVSVQLLAKSDASVAAQAEAYGTVFNWIKYPINTSGVALGGMFLDRNGFFLAEPTSPDGQFYKSETETIQMAGRATDTLATPVAPIMRTGAPKDAIADLYKLTYDNANPDGWYLQFAAKLDEVAFAAVTGASSPVKIYLNIAGWDGTSGWATQLGFNGHYEVGTGYTLTEVYKNVGVPNLVPTVAADNDRIFELSIPIGDYTSFIDPVYCDANGTPNMIAVTFSIESMGQFPTPLVEFYIQAAPALPDFYMTGVGGETYVYAPSMTPTVDAGTFPAADELGGTGYEQWPNGIYRIVDDQLYINIAAGVPGYISDYTGTITNITVYGCDPDTGEIVETHFLNQVAWVYSNYQYALPDMPVLSGSLKWRASIEPYLTQTSTGDLYYKTIDVPVLVSDPDAKILSIDGVTVSEPQATLAVSYNLPAYATTRLLDITSVVYAMPAGAVTVADGPHTAVILVNGQESTIEFTMESY